MVETLVLVAFAALVVGVVGSLLPLVPGPLASLGGVLLYWYATGYADPGPIALAAFVLVLLATVAVDYVGGALTAKVGGASTTTTIVAAVVGFALVFVAGPVGLVVGIAATVFALEYYQREDTQASARAAGYATLGVLASAVVQVLVTASVLVAMLLVHFL